MNSWLPILIFVVAVIFGWYSPRTWVWLAILAIPAYIIKFSIGPVPTNLIELIIWGGALGWIIHQPKLNLGLLLSRYKPIWWQLSLLLVGLVLGVIVSGDLRLSFGIVKGWFITPILFYGVVSSILTSITILEIIPMLMLSTLPISLTALVQVVTQHFTTIDGRASAWFISANYLSLYLVPILLLGTITIFNRWYPRASWFYWAVTVPSLLAIYFSYSYGGWLGLVTGGLIIGLWQFRTKWQFWLVGVGAILVAGLTQLKTDRVAQMLNFKAQSSASVRLQVWATDWLMTKEHWLTGIGLGGYPVWYSEFVTRLFTNPIELGMLHTHNLYFQFIINLGIAGLVGFVALIVKFFVWVRRCPSSIGIPLVATMTSILVHGLVDTPYWKNDLSILVWLLLAIASLVSKPKYV